MTAPMSGPAVDIEPCHSCDEKAQLQQLRRMSAESSKKKVTLLHVPLLLTCTLFSCCVAAVVASQKQDDHCIDNPSYRSSLNLSCSQHASVPCHRLVDVGFSGDELQDLFRNCPISCHAPQCSDRVGYPDSGSVGTLSSSRMLGQADDVNPLNDPSFSVAQIHDDPATNGQVTGDFEACVEGWAASCQDDPDWRSTAMNLPCHLHLELLAPGANCYSWLDLGYSNQEVDELVDSCPCTCGVECVTSAPSSQPSLSTSVEPCFPGWESTCQDDPDYASNDTAKLSMACEMHTRLDCTRFELIGYTTEDVHHLVDSCPCSCRVECGTWTLPPTDSPTAAPSSRPSKTPTAIPSAAPTFLPSSVPSGDAVVDSSTHSCDGICEGEGPHYLCAGWQMDGIVKMNCLGGACQYLREGEEVSPDWCTYRTFDGVGDDAAGGDDLTDEPSGTPTNAPTEAPTPKPSVKPTASPTPNPTVKPTDPPADESVASSAKNCDEICEGDGPSYRCTRWPWDGIVKYNCRGTACQYLREGEESNPDWCTYMTVDDKTSDDGDGVN